MATDSLMLHSSRRVVYALCPCLDSKRFSVTILNNQIQKNGAVPVLGSRPSETGSFFSLGTLTFRILPVRTQLPCWNRLWPHGKTTYWCSGDQPQITS